MDSESRWISGFWRRVGALFIDTLILGLIGVLLGLFLEDWLVSLGNWGRLIGFSIALVYFGILNSRIGLGQTLGKRILKIRVVNNNNDPISLGRSLTRYVVLGTPLILNGLSLPSSAMSTWFLYPLFLVSFCGIFATGYLYIFNRRTRQSLHDLVVGTYVVNVDSESSSLQTIWKVHYGVVGVLFVSACILPLFTSESVSTESSRDILRSKEVLSNHPSVRQVSLNSWTYFQSIAGDSKSKVIEVQISLSENNVSDVELAKSLARSLVDSYPAAIQKDAIRVILTYGYDIGIATKWATHVHRFVPNELVSNQPVVALLSSIGLNAGMSGNEVSERLGPPIDRGLHGKVDEWHYCSNNDGDDDYLILYFVRDALVAAGNYGVSANVMNDCSLYVKTGSYRPPDYSAITNLAEENRPVNN